MPFFCGLDVNNNVGSVSDEVLSKYDFLVHNIGEQSMKIDNFKFSKSSGHTSLDNNKCILGKISDTLKISDLMLNLEYAQYLGIPATILNINENFFEICHHLSQRMHHNLNYLQIILEFNLGLEINNFHMNGDGLNNGPSSWNKWDSIKGMLKEIVSENLSFSAGSSGVSRIQLALVLTKDIPSSQIVSRWLTEPIKYIIIPSHLFVKNKLGYPILSKEHQHLFSQLFKINPYLIIRAQSGEEPLGIYLEYMSHIRKVFEDNNPQLTLTAGYEDVLQFPLQPLGDHLDSHTYETFEMDDVKYIQYESAIYYYLINCSVNMEQDPHQECLIMVVGAGRGPLITASLNAAKRSQRRIKVVGIEKNPFSFKVLKDKLVGVWRDEPVVLIHGDMRTINNNYGFDLSTQNLNHDTNESEITISNYLLNQISTTPFHNNQTPSNNHEFEMEDDLLRIDIKLLGNVDLMVSELLGSFGDNELSPECLYGAQRFLKTNGISIPQSYTSYIAPIMSPKLHKEVKNYESMNYNVKNVDTFSHYEMPFVVNMCRKLTLSQPKAVFTFTHPEPKIWELHSKGNFGYNKIENIEGLSKRKICLRFNYELDVDSYLHGFAGYFEATLYKHVKLSILPQTHTPNMNSWFPIYFPIKEEMFVSRDLKGKEDAIILNIWRCANTVNVWYEWMAGLSRSSKDEFYLYTHIHNVNGRSNAISLI